MKPTTLKEIIKQRMHSPRVAMFLVLNLCGLIGFFTSFALARYAGLSQMWIRYLIALTVSYLAFFLLIKLWLLIFFEQHGTVLVQGEPEKKDKGKKKKVVETQGDTGNFGSLDFGDEGLLIIILLGVLFSVLIMAGFFIAAAPAFFSEVLGTALLSSGMYKGLTRKNNEEWWQTVFRRSRFYYLGMAVTFGLAGFLFNLLYPEAVTIGDILRGIF